MGAASSRPGGRRAVGAVGLGKSAASHRAGIALVVVLWVILVLSLLISGFAFTMQVEMQVASFSRKELKAAALARTGVELARRELLQNLGSGATAAYDAPNQDWATNTELLVHHALGEGFVDVKITDEESKMPVNSATPEQWHHLLDLLGVDPADADVIVDSIQDWIDSNDLHLLNGAEDDYYGSLVPPYRAKNAPLDRVEELLLVRGVTPALLTGNPEADNSDGQAGMIGLVTTTSSGKINVNTASPTVLKAALGLDDVQVDAVLNRRQGADGVIGTDDDQPFGSVSEFLPLLGQLVAGQPQQVRNAATVKSSFFTVRATGTVGNVRRTIVTVLRRTDNAVTPVLWREERGGAPAVVPPES